MALILCDFLQCVLRPPSWSLCHEAGRMNYNNNTITVFTVFCKQKRYLLNFLTLDSCLSSSWRSVNAPYIHNKYLNKCSVPLCFTFRHIFGRRLKHKRNFRNYILYICFTTMFILLIFYHVHMGPSHHGCHTVHCQWLLKLETCISEFKSQLQKSISMKILTSYSM